MTLKTNPSEKVYKGPVKLDYISASGSMSWLRCGLQWRLSHIDNIARVKTSAKLVFGTAYHRSFEPFWKGETSLNFKEKWLPFKNSSAIDFGNMSWLQYYKLGSEMVGTLVEKMTDKFDPVSSRVELSENVDLGFVVLRRRIDLITEVKNLDVLVPGDGVTKFDGPIMFDLKTSGKKYSEMSILTSQQLKTYSIPSRDRDNNQKLYAYLVVTKQVTPQVQIIGKKFEKEEIKQQVTRLRSVVDQIRRGVFIKNEGDHCGWCDFKELCQNTPGWKNMYVEKMKAKADDVVKKE